MSTSTPTDLQTTHELKLEAPRLPTGVVYRARLISVLAAVDTTRLILVAAPAGFGKTTLLSQWRDHLRQIGELVAWLTLDESDADVRRFMIGVIKSLTKAGVDLGPLPAQAQRGLTEVTVDSVIRDIQSRLHLIDKPVTLILDDYHRTSSPTLDALLGQWIPLLPQGTRFLMSTRRRPDIGLRQLLGKGQAIEIIGDTLRFNTAESREVLDVGLGEAERDILAKRTEGWPVALQLARIITLQDQIGPTVLTNLISRGGRLWNFLSDQVLRGLNKEVVEFLLETSILERFTTEITDQIRGRNDSWKIIEQLEPLQSLLTPLDAETMWYRYHHLFSEYLQGQLRQRNESTLSALHLRASRAFENSGLLAEAVRHASLAGDFRRCAELVEKAGGWRFVLFGGMGQLNQLLDFIPKSERLSHPRLLLAQAYVELKKGLLHEARSTFDLVANDIAEPIGHWGTLDDCERDVLNINVLMKTYEDNRIDGHFLSFFDLMRQRMPGADALTRGVLDCAASVASLCLGELNRAEDFARQAMRAMREANSVLGLNYCFLHAGLSRIYKGDLGNAAAYVQRAKAMAIENFGEDSGLKALATMLLALAELWSDVKLTISTEDLDNAFRHVCEYDGWFEIYAAGLDTRFRLAWLANNVTAMDIIIADGDRLTRSRSLKRLAWVVDTQRLLRLRVTNDPAGDTLAEKIGKQFPIGCWRNNPACWRPYQDAAFALATWYLPCDLRRARHWGDDMLICAQAVGTRSYEVRAHLLLATIQAATNAQDKAMVHLRAAVKCGAHQRIALPFIEHPALSPLVRLLRRELWDAGGEPIEASFLSNVEEKLTTVSPARGGSMSGLTTREQEIIFELSRGLTNKEIARALDMTEHTVKFHLKNIFAKLGVDRRAHALSALKQTSQTPNLI